MTSTIPLATSSPTVMMPTSTARGGHVYGTNLGPLTSVFSAPLSCINPSNIWVSEFVTTTDSTTTETFELYVTSTCAPSANAVPCYPPNFKVPTEFDNEGHYYSPASQCPEYYTTQTVTWDDHALYDRKAGEVAAICCPRDFVLVRNYWDVYCTYTHLKSTGKTDVVTASYCDGRRDTFTRPLEIYAPAINIRYQLTDIKPGFTGVTPRLSAAQTTTAKTTGQSLTDNSSPEATCGSNPSQCGNGSSASRPALRKAMLGLCIALPVMALLA
nr:uncharacterized protein CTRU02_13313 [Colletotrichum truncatum]KAF6783550.1 hypothetical protein CTRU02_13313 [Colletotrichum truncatum]